MMVRYKHSQCLCGKRYFLSDFRIFMFNNCTVEIYSYRHKLLMFYRIIIFVAIVTVAVVTIVTISISAISVRTIVCITSIASIFAILAITVVVAIFLLRHINTIKYDTWVRYLVLRSQTVDHTKAFFWSIVCAADVNGSIGTTTYLERICYQTYRSCIKDDEVVYFFKEVDCSVQRFACKKFCRVWRNRSCHQQIKVGIDS